MNFLFATFLSLDGRRQIMSFIYEHSLLALEDTIHSNLY